MTNLNNIINHSEVSEKEIEKYLCKRVTELGGICLKYSNSNMVGYPDRVALLPKRVTIWVELKSKGRKPSKIQSERFKQMEEMGHPVFVCDSKESIDDLLNCFSDDL